MRKHFVESGVVVVSCFSESPFVVALIEQKDLVGKKIVQLEIFGNAINIDRNS